VRRNIVALAAAALALSGAGSCGVEIYSDSEDPLLHGDRINSATGRVVENVPRTPIVWPGADGTLGTRDDVIAPLPTGDNDLVLRSGITGFTGPIPAPSARDAGGPLAVAEPFGGGTPVPFVVSAVDGHQGVEFGVPVVSPSLEGAPVLALAFADLDGDGFVGITHLDGNPFDAEIERAELEPVGRRIALVQGGRASGSLFVSAGGPGAAPLRVVLGAAAYAGSFDPGFFNGAVPDGPAVMTRLPFVPRTNPIQAIDAGGGALLPAHPDSRAAVELGSAVDPDPSDPRFGEYFTLRTDGSDETIDAAWVSSGAFVRFGLGMRPNPETYHHLVSRPLRPGFDYYGWVVPYEILQHFSLADDGAASVQILRVLPLDRLGNVAERTEPALVTLRTGGAVRIVWPDLDGDPTVEILEVADTRGVDVIIDDSGGSFDDPPTDRLVVEGAGGLFYLDVSLPDPDVDESTLVDAADIAIVAALRGVRFGDADFDGRYDLNGDGVIHDADVAAVAAHQGTVIPVP